MLEFVLYYTSTRSNQTIQKVQLAWDMRTCGPKVQLKGLSTDTVFFQNASYLSPQTIFECLHFIIVGWKGGAVRTTRGFSAGEHYWGYSKPASSSKLLHVKSSALGIVSGILMMGVSIGEVDITQPSMYNSDQVEFIYDQDGDLYGKNK